MSTGTVETAPLTDTRAAQPCALPARLREFLLDNLQRDVAGTGAQTIANLPFTGEPLTAFAGASAADVEAAIARASRAQTA